MNYQIQSAINLATNKISYYDDDELYSFWKDKVIVKNNILQNSNLMNFNEFEKLCNDMITLHRINNNYLYKYSISGKTTKIILESIKYVIDYNKYVLIVTNEHEYSAKKKMHSYLDQIKSMYDICNIKRKIKFTKLYQPNNLDIAGINFDLVLLDLSI